MSAAPSFVRERRGGRFGSPSKKAIRRDGGHLGRPLRRQNSTMPNGSLATTLILSLLAVPAGLRADLVHSYSADAPGQTADSFLDGVGTRHWTLSRCAHAAIDSAATRFTAAYRLDPATSASGGSTAAFPGGDTTFEVWVRPGSLDGNHQVIFETGGGQNGSSFLITSTSVRFLNSTGNTRRFDMTVPLEGIDLSDFVQIVASLDATGGAITLSVRGAGGGRAALRAEGPVGRGGNGASLFNWGSGALGASHNNLGGRTEAGGASPAGLTQFRGEIALLNVYDTALDADEIDASFASIAGPQPTIASFAAEPSAIARGDTSRLSWTVENVDSVSIAPDVGSVDDRTVDGSGSIDVAPVNTTVYTLTASAGDLARTASVQVIVGGQLLPPQISEFQAANDGTIVDGDGASSDWIEIRNPNATALDLAGYFLTDTTEDLDRWRFPEITIPPLEHLLVFASGRDVARDIFDAGGHPHTTFRLSAGGEYLALVAPDGIAVVSEYAPTFPPQFEDVSFGIDAAGQRGYFVDPTPGGPNGRVGIGFVGPPTFSIDSGYFDDALSVEITPAEPESSVRYTLDGSEPTADADGAAGHGELLDGPIRISTTAVLRAVAYRDDYWPSDVETRTFVFPEDVVAQPNDPPGYPSAWAGVPADYEMDPDVVGEDDLFGGAYRDTIVADLLSLPAISLVMDREHLFGASGIYDNARSEGVAWERPGAVELIDPDGEEDGFRVNCGVRMQGGSSRSPNYPKHSFRLLFKREYGPGKLRYPLFANQPEGDEATEEYDTVILRAGFNNSWTHWHWYQCPRAQYIRDQWIRDSQLAMGSPSPHGRYVHLYLNGLYWGVYNLVERPSGPFAAAYHGGEREDYDVQNVNAAVDGNLTAWNRMMSIAEGGVADAASYAAIREYLDVDNLIDYMLLNFYVGNDDWDGHNWYAGRRREDGAGYRFFCWDSELIISRHQNNPPPPQPDFDIILRRDRTGLNNNNKPSRLYTRLRANAEFRLRFADRVWYHMFHDGVLTTERSIERWLARHEQIWQAVVAESARWGDYRRDVHQHANYTPEDYDLFHRDEHYVAYQEWLLGTYFPQRRNIYLGQLRARGLFPTLEPPRLTPWSAAVPPGEIVELEMATDDGTIYFALDGSDPRLEGGDVAPDAEVYDAPISIDGTTTVKARTLLRGEWSPLAETLFATDISALRITEIMYHPRRSEAENAPDADDFEFLEILNTSAADVDLTGVRLTGAVRFDFSSGAVPRLAPGERVVLARDLLDFAERYDLAQILVAGEYDGNLSNGGEEIVVRDARGDAVLRIEYDDAWYPTTDGLGHSLQLVDPALDPQQLSTRDAWRPSGPVDGTPGFPDVPAILEGWQLPSDFTQDNQLDITDAIALLGYLFQGGPDLPCDGAVELLDASGDDQVDLTDAVVVLQYLFQGGPPPAAGADCVRIANCPDACVAE